MTDKLEDVKQFIKDHDHDVANPHFQYLLQRMEAAEAVIIAYANETRFDNRWAHRRSQDAEKVWEEIKGVKVQ